MDTYLTYLDQFRYIFGTISTLLLLCHGILPAKPHYRIRVFISCGAAFLAAMGYVPLARFLSAAGIPLLPATMVYWCLMSLGPCLFIFICYRALFAGILFRALLTVSAENFMTAIVYYLFARCLFPDFERTYPLLYLLLLIIFYAVILFAGRYQLRSRVDTDENDFYQDPKRTALAYLFAYISVLVLFFAAKFCFEFVISPMKDNAEFAGIFRFLHYYLVLNLILLSVIISFIMISAYQMLTLRNEKQIITQIARDRKAQYEFSRESIEMIKRQAHDLKHQLRALEQITPEERNEELARANRSINYYDSVFRTGHEALDTILTEKSLYCRSRGIRLSCNVQSRLLAKIKVVDLYTLLGNALDNAIEAVDKLDDPEKKTITLTVRDQDEMLFIQVENYYEGSLTMEDGLPLTTKQDEENHGYGTKSIRTIVKSYGGAAMIRTEDNIFSLEILIPT